MGGFCQGRIVALTALLTTPERFAGAVCMSGRLLPEVLTHAASSERLHGKPVMIVHGPDDQKLGVHLARWAREKLEPMSLSLTYRELAMGHEITAESLGEVSAWLTSRLDPGVTA